MTENVEKTRELIHQDHHEQSQELADFIRIIYGACQILAENLNMHCIAPSSRQSAHQHIPENHSLQLTATWLSFPILPTHWT
jgi:hypothetical protein